MRYLVAAGLASTAAFAVTFYGYKALEWLRAWVREALNLSGDEIQ